MLKMMYKRAFLSGYMANKDRDLKEITCFQHLYDSFKESCYMDRFGNKKVTA